MSLFDRLHDAWEPICDPCSRVEDAVFVGTIPGDVLVLDVDAGVLRCQGREYHRRTLVEEIEEDGPGAWGAGLTIARGAYFRWNPDEGDSDGWSMAKQDDYITISTGGSTLETITIRDDGTVDWICRRFVAA